MNPLMIISIQFGPLFSCFPHCISLNICHLDYIHCHKMEVLTRLPWKNYPWMNLGICYNRALRKAYNLTTGFSVAIKKLYKWILSSETPLCCFEKRYNLARETFPRKSPCIVFAYKLEENLVHLLERLNFCSDDNKYFSL